MALGEDGFGELAASDGHDAEVFRKGVDSLRAYTVQTDAELEHLIVVLGTGIDDRDAFDDFPEGDTAAKVTHADTVALDVDRDLVSIPHYELIDCIIDDFL